MERGAKHEVLRNGVFFPRMTGRFDKTMAIGWRFGAALVPVLAAAMTAGTPAFAQKIKTEMPEDILPPAAPAAPAKKAARSIPPAGTAPAASSPASTTAPAPVVTPSGVPTVSAPVVQDVVVPEPVMAWTVADARALLQTIEFIGKEGLQPADYQPAALRAAIAAGEGDDLDALASRVFGWLIEDLRDGRTPMPARVQWFAIDPDQDAMPTAQVMAQALSDHDVPGVVARLAPTSPDYAALKADLNATPMAQKERRALIQANMDRWRWLARDLGQVYLMTNVPEFQLRLVVKDKILRTYKTVVGKPGRTATPQLAETVSAVVFNPTWTVPQSIVKGEGLGAKVLGNPRWAAASGYKGTKNADGTITVVQQPGPNNALGLMKIDMPNPHAIYLHDTPSKQYFNEEVRAFSHGCIRTERAVELGMTMAILGAQMPAAQAAEISRSGTYTKVAMTRTFPVYLTYFTYARAIDGTMKSFGDLYGRDLPVLASFKAPRVLKTTQRASDEAIIQLDNPL